MVVGPAVGVSVEMGSGNEVLIRCGVSGRFGGGRGPGPRAGVNLSAEAADNGQSADVGLQLRLSGPENGGGRGDRV